MCLVRYAGIFACQANELSELSKISYENGARVLISCTIHPNLDTHISKQTGALIFIFLTHSVRNDEDGFEVDHTINPCSLVSSLFRFLSLSLLLASTDKLIRGHTHF